MDALTKRLIKRTEDRAEENRKEWNWSLLPMMCVGLFSWIFFFGGFVEGGNPYIAFPIGILASVGFYLLCYDKEEKGK